MTAKTGLVPAEYKDCPLGALVDRYEDKSSAEPIDVLMLTLDAAAFLERCLFSVYREVPVKRLVVCDGGSRDGTIEILNKYPRVHVYVRPDIRTTGKAVEFLLSKIETEWFAIIDSDIELHRGWYDEMCKHRVEYDMLENSRRLLAYHFCRVDTRKLNVNARSYDFCHLGQKESIKHFKCDDDYIWRLTDFFFRQQVEKSGYRYGKIASTHHLHHETDRAPYASDPDKQYQKIVFRGPEWVILDEKKHEMMLRNWIKGVVKYMDPEYTLAKDEIFDKMMTKMLSREWIAENGLAWLQRYDEASSLRGRLRPYARFVRRMAAHLVSVLRQRGLSRNLG